MGSAGLDDLLRYEAGALAAAIRGRRVSAVEAVAASLHAIERAAGLNAFITVCAERALARARAGVSGPLAGVPFVAKDLLDTACVRTTFGSALCRHRVPSRSASAVLRLEAAGAILVGKTNLHEFAWGATSQNPHFGTVANPRRPGHVAGGSSGGSAAALAAGLCPLALGTDTGGSVRIPAACCGVVGLRPRLATIPLDGCFPLAPSFDTVGPMARSVRDCALAFRALTGTTVRPAPLDGVRIGVLGVPPDLARFEALGARLVGARLPEPAGDSFLAEVVATHRGTYRHAREQLGPDLVAKYRAARRALADCPPINARGALAASRAAADALPVDLVVTPAIDGVLPRADCWEPDVRAALTRWTRPFSFLDWAAIAVGDIQIAGRTEEAVLGAALSYEAALL